MVAVKRAWTGWAHRADPRLKWLGTLALIVVFVSLRRPEALAAGIATTGLGALLAAGVSPRPLGARLLAALPFVLVAGLALAWSGTGGPLRAAALALRVLGAVLAMAVLTLSTERARFFAGAAGLGFPVVILDLADLTLRYFAVLGEEARRMTRARRARGFEAAVIWRPAAATALGSLVGALFLRSLDRAERVHLARLARSGETGAGGAGTPIACPPASVGANLAWLGLTLLPAILMIVVERCYLL